MRRRRDELGYDFISITKMIGAGFGGHRAGDGCGSGSGRRTNGDGSGDGYTNILELSQLGPRRAFYLDEEYGTTDV